MSKKSQFGMTLLLSTIIVGGANASTVSTSNTLGATMIAQQGAVCKGVVKDATGEPIIGASVSVKGTKNATVTDLDGNFTLSGVNKGTTIEITYIGYITREIKWAGKDLDVILSEDTQGLDEVVVVGYGSSKKRDLIASVSTVKAEEMSNIPVTNIAQGLAGRSPGLIVQANGGGVNATPSISIRGGGTPLYVIDGVVRGEVVFRNLSPDDIESMSIL